MISSSKVLEAMIGLQDSDDSPSGIQARFVPLSETVGVKVFRNKAERNIGFKRQSQFSQIGWAPEVYVKIDLPQKYGGNFRYGLVVEKLETVLERESMDSWYENDGKKRYKITEKIQEDTGWFFHDPHYGNWGYKNGKMIPIDFGFIPKSEKQRDHEAKMSLL